ncbi:hypothetical protein C3495_05860 [Clostridiaceae bacterium 14S0207]|nr:hypothetical protein C3495_05860 [Clostridiaceae bacterium 14S0207]
MSKKISLNVSDEQYEEILQKSKINNQTVTDFILNNLPITHYTKLTLNKINNKVNKLKKGKKFSIPELFDKTMEWDKFTKGSRLTVGKLFYQSVTQGDPISKQVEYLEKTLLI